MKIHQVPNLFYSGHYGQNSKLQESLKCRIFAVLTGGFRLQAAGIRQKTRNTFILSVYELSTYCG